jgi:MbtH protein
MSEIEDDMRYQVVMNHEDQYSIWFADRELPAGWYKAGPSGTRQECLDHIEKVWTDMRPRSVRMHMENVAAARDRGETS